MLEHPSFVEFDDDRSAAGRFNELKTYALGDFGKNSQMDIICAI